MNILIVSQYFWPENFRVNDLAEELVNRGHKVTVLTGLPNYPDGKLFESYRKNPKAFSHLNGIQIIRVPVLTRGKGGVRLILNYLSYAIMACIVGLWKLRNRNIDIVFVNQLSPVTVGIPGALIARMKKVPMVMWVLDLWPDTLHAIGIVRSKKMLSWIGTLVALIYQHCDLILAQSKSFVPIIQKLAPRGSRVEYFPSWAEALFENGKLQDTIKIPTSTNSFDVLFAGNIGEAQDFPCILRAAELLKKVENIRWLIVGNGRMRSWVEQEIKKRDLSKQVLLLGQFPLEEMPSFYQRADALLVTLQDKPIFNMTIPGKLQSYLAAGRPIIGALNGEGATLLNTSQAGYVCSAGDHIGLANAVLKISRLSDNERNAMGENGKSISQREFDRTLVLNKLETFLKELVVQFK